jgi:hypothetical protein
MRAWAKGKMYDENVKDMHKQHVFVKFTIFYVSKKYRQDLSVHIIGSYFMIYL